LVASTIQIQPPQPNSSQDFKVLGALLFGRSVKRDIELLIGAGKQVVVGVGDSREPEATPERPQGRSRTGKRAAGHRPSMRRPGQEYVTPPMIP